VGRAVQTVNIDDDDDREDEADIDDDREDDVWSVKSVHRFELDNG